MVSLKEWMRSNSVTDAGMADRIGGMSACGVRKLRFRTRGPSIRVAARIEEVTGGMVRSADLQPKKAALPVEEATPC